MTFERVARLFNGTYTIRNRTTGKHRTFRITTQKPDATFAPGRRVVSLLTGADNTRDYTRFGFVSDAGIEVFAKHRALAGGKPTDWEQYARMLWDLAVENGRWLAASHELQQAGTCILCNRLLTDPVSIATGIGPVCGGRSARGEREMGGDAESESA